MQVKMQISRRFALLLTIAEDLYFYLASDMLDTRRIWLGTNPGYSEVKSCSLCV